MSDDFDFEAAEEQFTEPSDLDGYGNVSADEASAVYLAHADNLPEDASGVDIAAYAVKHSVPLVLAALREQGIPPTVENLAMLVAAWAATVGHALGEEGSFMLSALAKGLVLKIVQDEQNQD